MRLSWGILRLTLKAGGQQNWSNEPLGAIPGFAPLNVHVVGLSPPPPPAFSQVMLELARIHLLQGHLDLCEQQCAALLHTEQTHEAAAVVGGP